MHESTQEITNAARRFAKEHLFDLPRPRGSQVLDQLRLDGAFRGRTIIIARNYLWIEREGAVPYPAIVKYNRVDAKRIGVKISWVSRTDEIKLVEGSIFRFWNIGAKKRIDRFVHRLHERVTHHRQLAQMPAEKRGTPCPICDCELPLDRFPESAAQIFCENCFNVLPLPIGPASARWRHLGFCEGCGFYEPIGEYTHYFTWSLVFASFTCERVRYLCRRCARWDMLAPLAGTCLLGWWAVPFGPFVAALSLFRNVRSGCLSLGGHALEDDEFSTDLAEFVAVLKTFNVGKAEQEFERLKKSYPTHFALYYNLARLYFLRGKKDRASDLMLDAQKFLPNLPKN